MRQRKARQSERNMLSPEGHDRERKRKIEKKHNPHPIRKDRRDETCQIGESKLNMQTISPKTMKYEMTNDTKTQKNKTHESSLDLPHPEEKNSKPKYDINIKQAKKKSQANKKSGTQPHLKKKNCKMQSEINRRQQLKDLKNEMRRGHH
jgi:hypothetical protein